MDFEKIIHTIVDPILIKPEAIMVRELPSDSEDDITLLIVAENEDTARLIGKKGSVANSLREFHMRTYIINFLKTMVSNNSIV